MFHMKDERSTKLYLCTLSEVVYHFLFLLLLPHGCKGFPQVIGSSEPIVVNVGDDVMLPCLLKQSVNAATQTVEWTRPDLKPRFVHLWRSGVEILDDQNPSYVGRTSLFISELKNGNVSLKLSRVKLSDKGKYRCFMPNINRDTTVELTFGSVSSLIVHVSADSDGLSLDCQSKGWFPKPDVLWLDSEGKVLFAEPTETILGPDGLFTVSSKLTVEKRNSNSFTCRVHQQNINETRETHIQIPVELFLEHTRCAVLLPIFVVVIIILVVVIIILVIVLVKKFGQNTKYKMHYVKVTLKGRREEGEQLIKGNKTMEDLDCEKLQEKEEEKNDMQHVISILENQKKELEKTKNEYISKLEKVKEEWRENEKKLKKLNQGFNWHKDTTESSLLKLKIDLEKEEKEYKEYLKNIEEKIQKSKEIVSKMEKRKKKVENQIDEIKNAVDVTKKQQVKKKSGENKNKLQEVTDSCRGNKHNESSPHLEFRIETENKETEHDGTDRNLEENINMEPKLEEQTTEPESAYNGKKTKKKEEKEKGEGKTIIQKAKDMLPGKKHDKTNPHSKSEPELENKETEHEKPLSSTEKNLEENINMEPKLEEQTTEPESSNNGKKTKKKEEKEKGEKKKILQKVTDRLPGKKHDKTNPRSKSEPELENKETEHEKPLSSTEKNLEENVNMGPKLEEQTTEPESANNGRKTKKKEEKEKGEKKKILQKVTDRLPGKKHDKTNPHLESELELENKETEHEKPLDGSEKNLEENVNMEPLPEEQKTEPESANIGKKNRKEEKEKGEKKTKFQRLSNRLPWNKHDAEPELENKELEVQVKIQSDERDNEETHQQTFE